VKPRHALGLVALLCYLFLYAPILVLVAFSFNEARLGSVWAGFTLSWYVKAFDNRLIQQSLRTSLGVALLATLASTVIGTAMALALHRYESRRRGAIEALERLHERQTPLDRRRAEPLGERRVVSEGRDECVVKRDALGEPREPVQYPEGWIGGC
jgi:hypothetical protein